MAEIPVKEMILLCEGKNFDSNVTPNILSELQMYSCFKVENETEGAGVIQKLFVPKNEHEFYKKWKEQIENQLRNSSQNAVLIRNIARRHKFRLQR